MNIMKRNILHHAIQTTALAMVTLALCAGVPAQAQLIEDFSGDLSLWTSTRILNNGNHSPTNTCSWGISGGALQFTTASYTGIEQYALTRTDYTLGIGYELSATFSAAFTGTQDIGIYVGAGTPTTDLRANYLDVYKRNTGNIYSRGMDGTTEYGTYNPGIAPTISAMFIARTAVNIFECGYYDASNVRNILYTRTISNNNAVGIGSSIGFYADVRAAGIVGSMDNLTLAPIPEPATMSLCGLGGLLGLAGWLRRK
jgi:hypothetical protein